MLIRVFLVVSSKQIQQSEANMTEPRFFVIVLAQKIANYVHLIN